ncbi:MAG: alkaline phosphatase [Pyrinomonadaceae bacterium]
MKKLLLRRIFARILLVAAFFAFLTPMAQMQIAKNEKTTNVVVPPPYPVKRQENRESWYKNGEMAMIRAKQIAGKIRRAKNVILFIGDGMGISTITAARILEGQLRGESGEENQLSFEQFENVALSKTYSVNQQTSDSAPTMTAIVTGVKTKDGILSVDQTVVRGDYKTVKGNELPTVLEMAEQRGMSTGVVTTTRVTHATPAACYAHIADRDWESDANLPKDAVDAKFPDIARQLIEFPFGDGLEVALGGGRAYFLPRETTDPEYPSEKGNRKDGRNLTEEWTKKHQNSAYIWNKQQFDAIDSKKTHHLLGLFERSHMKYEHDRPKDVAGEPSLTEMTTKAIDVLSNNKKGYFLMVEGGRIDHAHHEGNAFRALTETIEFSNAIRAALAKVNLKDTLVIVTADHSHTFNIGGYPVRGNNILGLVRSNDDQGNADNRYDLDKNGLPYTTLNYANGRGALPKRPDLTTVDTTAPDYKQEAIASLADETHGGEDVAIFATGAGANLVRGVMEQNWIFQVMRESLRLPPPKR